MHSKEELLEQLGEGYGYVNRLVEKKVEYFKLNLAETSASTISSVITAIVLVILGLIFLVFALITLGFALTAAFENPVYGFGAVTLLLLIVFLLIILFRKPLITNPVVSSVISTFFKHDGKDV